jgi:hypothetical protein
MTQTLRGKTTLLVLGAATVNSPRSPFPWCSKLCSDRVGKRQIGTRQDKIAIGGFWLETGRTWRESRDANRALVGLANHRLQPLGHLTAARRLSIRHDSSCEHQKIVVIVPETMPASLEEPRSERRQFPFADLVGKGGGFFSGVFCVPRSTSALFGMLPDPAHRSHTSGVGRQLSCVRRSLGRTDRASTRKHLMTASVLKPAYPVDQETLRLVCCPQDCPCDAPKQRLQGQRQPTRSIREVETMEGFTRKIEVGREASFRLANRRLQPLGHLTAARILSINDIATYASFVVPILSL